MNETRMGDEQIAELLADLDECIAGYVPINDATAAIRQLLAERDEARSHVRELAPKWEEAKRNIETLRAQLFATTSKLAEARKDSERLDWLEALADCEIAHARDWSIEYDWVGHNAPTLREAIDAALDPARKGEK